MPTLTTAASHGVVFLGLARTGSVVMITDFAERLAQHLHRRDGQEDLCFLLWRPSVGVSIFGTHTVRCPATA